METSVMLAKTRKVEEKKKMSRNRWRELLTKQGSMEKKIWEMSTSP